MLSACPRQRSRRSRGAITVAAMHIALAGCSRDAVVQRIAPERNALARSFIALVQRGSIDSAIARVAPDVAAEPGVRSALELIRDSLHGLQLESLTVAGATSQGTKASFLFETPRAPRWRLIHAEVDGDRIADLHMWPDAAERYQQNALRVWEHPTWEFLLLISPLIVALFSVSTAVYVWRTAPRRRALLAVLALLSVGKLVLNWTTGAISFPMVSLMIGLDFITRPSEFEPYIITNALPLGALLALYIARRMRRVATAATAPDQSAAMSMGS